MSRTTHRIGLAVLVLLAAACESDDSNDGVGTLEISAYGEPFIEQGIPVEAMSDGWAVEFTSFEVDVSAVSFGGETLAAVEPVELALATGSEGQVIGALSLGPGTYLDGSYELSEMRVVGTATKEDQSIRFAWVFDTAQVYSNCEANPTVVESGVESFEITIHADHLFFDSLVSEDPVMGFQAFADADADADGTLTRAELESASIGAFDPGNIDVEDLWQWLQAQAATVGHVNGEGHCQLMAP